MRQQKQINTTTLNNDNNVNNNITNNYLLNSFSMHIMKRQAKETPAAAIMIIITSRSAEDDDDDYKPCNLVRHNIPDSTLIITSSIRLDVLISLTYPCIFFALSSPQMSLNR